jgi:hypothetical protein
VTLGVNDAGASSAAAFVILHGQFVSTLFAVEWEVAAGQPTTPAIFTHPPGSL